MALRPVTADNVRATCELQVIPNQLHIVAPNSVSLAQALFEAQHAWYRAFHAGEVRL